MSKKTFEFEGWKYVYDEESGYKIIPRDTTNQPSSFFKYYALSQNSVDALTNMYVYATHPHQFNDPFDCNDKLIEFSTWKDIKNLCDNDSLFKNLQETYPSLDDACAFAQKAYWNILYKKLGLVSLTTKHDNYKMWALYAQNNGFCVEFDPTSFSFQKYGPFRIQYVEDFLKPIHIGEYGGNIAMLVQPNIKNNIWQDEEEWRLYIPSPPGMDMKHFGNEYEIKTYNFGDEHDRKFRYSLAALKSVTLGSKFFNRLCSNILSLLEVDIACCRDRHPLEYAVLDFLARITEKTDVKVKLASLADFKSFNFDNAIIIKYSEEKFRIILCDK